MFSYFSDISNKFNLQYYLRGGFWLTLASVVNILISFGLTWIMGNYLSQEVYGEYRYLLSIAGIISAFCISGYSFTVVNHVAKGDTEILYRATKNTFTSSLSGTIVGLIGAIYYFMHDNQVLSLGFLIISIFTPFMNAFQLYIPYLNGKKDFKMQTNYGFFPDIFVFICMALTVVYFKNPLYILFAYFITSIFSHGFVYLKSTAKYPVDKNSKINESGFSLQLTFNNLIYTCYQQLDKILIFTFIGSKELAVYTFAILFSIQIRGQMRILISLTSPMIAKSNFIVSKEVFKKLNFLTVIMFFIFIIYYITAKIIFFYAFPKYMDSIVYSQIVAISLITLPYTYYISGYLMAKESKKTSTNIAFISSSINILTTFILVTNYGVFGAITSFVLNSFITLFVSIIFFRRLIK